MRARRSVRTLWNIGLCGAEHARSQLMRSFVRWTVRPSRPVAKLGFEFGKGVRSGVRSRSVQLRFGASSSVHAVERSFVWREPGAVREYSSWRGGRPPGLTATVAGVARWQIAGPRSTAAVWVAARRWPAE